MRLRRRRHARPAPSDEQLRLFLVADLVGLHIVRGLTPKEVLDHIGYTYQSAPRKEKLRVGRKNWATYKLALVERKMADGCLSTLQRYARAVGGQLRIAVGSQQSRRKTQRRKMRRVHRNGALKRRVLHKSRLARRR